MKIINKTSNYIPSIQVYKGRQCNFGHFIWLLDESNVALENTQPLPLAHKSKAHPLQAMQAQRGLRELRLLDFLASALYGGRLSAAFTPWEIPGTHFHEGLS
jgi:hypothetical protein